ncbi:MAG: HAMP domain-containing histidine kinase [Eubacterium sp.]|nr:HAMP domain-containing histidine kinase [Eubacterium sp.]
MYRNYKQALDVELRNAASENNMVKASIEYELLSVLNSETYKISDDVSRIAKRVDSGMLLSGSTLYIKLEDNIVYSGAEDEETIPGEITTDQTTDSKRYIYQDNGKQYYVYVSSPAYINNANLYIITRKDITNVYSQLNDNLQFLKIISIIVLLVSALIMYLISVLLTRPLEKLNMITTKISGGDYSVRADIDTNDEVGELADNFNTMAGSVEDHVEELKDMVKRRDQFVADFTHEMKTPMTTIIGYADSVRHLELSEEERDMSLEYIYSEGIRLETMSQKLFDLIYLKDNDIFMEELDAAELGEQIEHLMQPIMKGKNITLKTTFEEGTVYGDAELIKTVFINLLDNARKASEERSVVSFTGKVKETDGNKVYEYLVEDTGIGMSEETRKRVFDEFYMADKSRTRKEGGAGLGMSLVSIILEKHNADIDIESEEGKGTRVYTRWRMESEDEEEA